LADNASGRHSIYIRHDYIHEYHVGQDASTELDGCLAIGCLTGQFQVIKNLQEGCQAAAHHRMIIHEQHANRG
jgi:hypothetical protein